MERRIRVTGKGKLAVKPDMICLMMELSDVDYDYEKTLKESASQTELLKDCFEKLGFQRTDLKTTYFNVDTEYDRYQDKDNVWRSRFAGYRFTHKLKLEFDADNKLLGKILYELTHIPVNPEFRMMYTIKDVDAAKNELLGKAVADSKKKAEVLTEAAGVKLGNIISIDYSWGEINICSDVKYGMTEAMRVCEPTEMSYDMDIEPDDIDVTDTVTVVWEIG